jgi:glycerol transport system ATP-binding protein
MAKIELIDVSHAYVPGLYAVKDINLIWEDGVASALLGPSGCGKTTLLKIISGLLTPSEGQVLLNGQDVTKLSPRERNVAQVFQFPVVYETLNVFDNLAFPLRNRSVPENEIKARVEEIAEILELQHVLQHNAGRLGAAEKQRISMGRGIVRADTAAVLFDEPLTVIDPQHKWHLRRKLKELHQRTKFTMVYVTHDQHEALTFAEQVTVMDVGLALQTGTPQALHEYPQTPFVGYFIGSPGMNVFPAQLNSEGLQIGEYVVKLAANGLAGKRPYQLGIRPEHIVTSDEEQIGALACRVTAVTPTGHSQILDLQGGGLTFKARITEDKPVQIGQTQWATFPPKRLMVYADKQLVSLKQQRPEGSQLRNNQ